MTDLPTDAWNAALMADWATIWQSEWAAAAVDPETTEAPQRMAALWAAQAEAAKLWLVADAAARQARPAAPPGTPSAADASAAGLDSQADEPAPDLGTAPAPDPIRP